MGKYSSKSFFVRALLLWNSKSNDRKMPWKGENDPYKIWLSEIILQQTRVDQGLEYYNAFIHHFPTIKNLAKAKDEKVFKLWEGLGYYTRCKNLIITARYISNELNGIFPDKYEEILKLKGIGPYTAAAIASFAYNLPYPVVDGNVIRVLSRFFGISSAADTTEGKKIFAELAESVIDKKQAGIYNQAIMDFGATLCKPQLPQCTTCPLRSNCYAYKNDLVADLPKKKKAIIKRSRWLYYFLIENEHKFFIRKRNEKDIWENLYEFALAETSDRISDIKQEELIKEMLKDIVPLKKISVAEISRVYKQILTHQTIQGQFVHLKVSNIPVIKGFKAIPRDKLSQYPFPKFITTFLKDKMYL
jgi:A/G-specific adenine glycosylase